MQKIKTDYDSFEALNYSLAKELLTSPKGLVYNDKGDEEEKNKEKKQFTIGKAVHCLILEPENFPDYFLVTDKNLATKEGKQDKEYAEAMNLSILKQKDYEVIQIMVSEVLKNKNFKILLENKTHTELKLFRELPPIMETNKLPEFMPTIKGRLDLLTNTSHKCSDIKTIQAGIIKEDNLLKWHIKKYMYHLQAVFYNLLLGIDNPADMRYTLMFVESKAPYQTRLVELSFDWFIDGLILFKQAAKLYQIYVTEGAENVPGYELEDIILNF